MEDTHSYAIKNQRGASEDPLVLFSIRELAPRASNIMNLLTNGSGEHQTWPARVDLSLATTAFMMTTMKMVLRISREKMGSW